MANGAFMHLSHVALGLALVAGTHVIPGAFGQNLIDNTIPTLRIVIGLMVPLTLLVYCLPPFQRPSARRWRAVGRGLVALPAGTAVAYAATVLFGAPASWETLPASIHWAALASTVTVVPAACVLGPSPDRWARVFASARPLGAAEAALAASVYGAVLGAWLGAWPIPLDWEKPWQMWPIPCTYGLEVGYVAGLLAASVCASRAVESDQEQKRR